MENKQDGVLLVKRAEIDTQAPFRSVKEAVTLFGDKVLAGELYANRLIKQMHVGGSDNVAAELEETKQSLEKAKEESTRMADTLSYLKQELERTKKELQQLKKSEKDEEEEEIEFQKKRYVSFANPPSLSHVMIPQAVNALESHQSLPRKKKKSLIPLIGALFSHKKPTH